MFGPLSALNPFSQDWFFGPGRGASQRNLQQGQQYAYMGQDPYAAQQSQLIQMLMAQAQGTGPSLAGMQYERANQDAMSNAVAMSRGRGAGAGRNAANVVGGLGQSLAAGSAEARLREQMMAQQALQGSLSAAGQLNFQRAAANQAMYQQSLAQMLQQGGIGQSLMGLLGQGIGAYAMLRGPQGAAGPGMWANGQGSAYGMQKPARGYAQGGRPDNPMAGSDDWIRNGGY